MMAWFRRVLGLGTVDELRDDEIRTKALEINQEARLVIHESRDRRAVLQLQLEVLSRRSHKP